MLFRLLLIVFLFPFGFLSASQHTIDWKIEDSEIFQSRLNFEEAMYNDNYLIPSWQKRIEGKIIDHAYLGNTIFVPLNSNEQSLLGSEDFSEDVKVEVYLSQTDGKAISNILITPFRLNPQTNEIEKLVSFELELIEANAHSFFNASASRNTNAYAQNSVLASGDWFKMGILESGVYILNYNYLIGLNPLFNDANLSSIKVFGNGGDMLPLTNNDPSRKDDLVENALGIFDQNNNGKMNPGDYLLFYGDATDKWDLKDGKFEREINIYADTSYYFLTISGTNALRIQNRSSIGQAAQQIFTSFDERQQHQSENVNLLESGISWYGELFDFNLQQNFSFSFPNLDQNQDLCVDVNFVAQSSPRLSGTEYLVNVNGIQIGGPNKMGGMDDPYGDKGRERFMSECLNPGANGVSDNFNIGINYNKSGFSNAKGYLDYITVQGRRNLIWNGTQQSFRRKETFNSGNFGFQLSNIPNDAVIWDISNPLNPVRQEYTKNGSSAEFKIQSQAGSLDEFIIFTPGLARNPNTVRKIVNQNLHGHQPKQLVIITHPSLYSEAERFTEYKRNEIGLSVHLVTTTQLYNEFASGRQDLSAIRDYLKMLYDRGDKLENVLLFGDASYDYKNRVPGNTNFVPIFESPISTNNIGSHSSDDYIGFLEDGAGLWPYNTPGQISHVLNIGVGRFPVKNLEEARIVVDKVIYYENKKNVLGDWLNRITFVADDGDGNLHMNDANSVSIRAARANPSLDIQKIYVDAYPELPSPSGAISVDGKNALDRAIQNGTLILNYSGHGGEVGWTEEQILRLDQIPKWGNYEKLAFFFTATCEFGRYDDPGVVSGGELVLLVGNGGAVSIMTTTRAVYASANKSLNEAFYDHAFDRDENGKGLTLGEIIRRTKNQSININNRSFALLGDPSMRLNYPDKKVLITSINGNDPNIIQDTLKALCLVNFKGQVTDLDSTVLTDFNGLIDIKVYDKVLSLKTLGNNGSKYSYTQYKNLLFKGKATVKNGEFSLDFVVPKDIDYSLGKGRISTYAYNPETGVDASGADSSFYVGASCDGVVADNDPPNIQIFLDDTTFTSGGLTSSSPELIAYLDDDNGINFTGTGIGHDITALVSANPGEKIILNDYYLSELDSYQKGKVNYRLKNIPPGAYTLNLKAWDTHNNSAEESVAFVVASDEEMAFERVMNYPNPFSSVTYFSLDHNKAEQDLEVNMNIYNSMGKLIRSGSFEIENSDTKIDGKNYDQFKWDGTNSNGEKLSSGIYHYEIQVTSKTDGTKHQEIKQLVYIK